MTNEKRLDLIDRQALGIGRCNPDAFPIQNMLYVAGWNGVINLLEQAPTVDAVHAAGACYCGECKHWKKCESSLIGEVMCCTGQGSVYIQKSADDFCSRGERREGE